jgi:Tfp pilus assembly protein PilX
MKNNKKGFAVFFITILVLMAMFGIVMNTALVAYFQSQIIRNVVRSSQVYYAAEGGVEDGLLRMRLRPTSSESTYNFNVGSSSVGIDISAVIGGSRTVTATGNISGIIRKVEVLWSLNSQEVSFYYGTQVGEGGMVMGNNARVKGNVFSNGSVISPSDKGYIDNSVIVAGSGNKIDGLIVGGNAMVHSCADSSITGDLTYVSGGSVVNCTAGASIKTRPNEIDPAPMPISSSQIQEWKSHAAAGGILNNDYILNDQSGEIGPIQIGTSLSPKGITIDNGSLLKIRGTIYVTGDVVFNNNSIIELESADYSSLSGIIIVEGTVTVDNGAILRGSGEEGSYLLIISNNDSLDPIHPAIFVGNNAEGAIFYTTSGVIFLKNNMAAREVTGYKIQINNNAEVEYDSGLENANFASGPGGSWKLKSWKEIE